MVPGDMPTPVMLFKEAIKNIINQAFLYALPNQARLSP
jgi:hypothetical protein